MNLLVLLDTSAIPRVLPDTASLLRNITISRLSTGDLPFLSPADTIVPYMACMIPLLSLSVTLW